MQKTSRRSVLLAVLSLAGAGCDGADDARHDEPSAVEAAHTAHGPTREAVACPPSDVASHPDRADTPEGELFGHKVSSYVTASAGVVTSVGVRIPLAAIEAAPADGPFQDDLVLDMPALAKAQTFLSQLRVNWLAYGHGPAPYGASHFDFHFHRGTSSEIDGITCSGSPRFPSEILTPDHEYPKTCVASMGYHAWPIADTGQGGTFTASLILGYTATRLVFIEPMITRATLLSRRDFERPITPPQKSGWGVRTRFPTRLRGLYEPDGLTLRMEFDQFVELD